MLKFFKLLGLIIFCQMVGVVGSYFTFASIPTWYAGLVKPSFSPPNYLFGPVWTVLYTLMGISVYRILELSKKKKGRDTALNLFWWQLFFNFIWTPVFFGARNLFGGLIIISVLVVLLVRTIKVFSKLDKLSAYLLIPYLFWVSFATVLNFSIWFLNR